MYVCIHAETPFISLSLSLSPHLSCIHRSISFGNEVWRKRKGCEGCMGGERNKSRPPPTLKMHIHFHTLQRQWGAHTLAAVSPTWPQHTQKHTHTHPTNPKTQPTAKMNACVPFSRCGWKSMPCHIYLHKSRSRICACINSGCGSGLCAFVFVCVRTKLNVTHLKKIIIKKEKHSHVYKKQTT